MCRLHICIIASVLLLVQAGVHVHAQENKRSKQWQGVGVEVNLLGSRVLKHEAKFNLPIPVVSPIGEVNIIQQTYGRKPWQQRRNYPVIGLGLAYTYYGVDSVYGRSISLYPNITLRLLKGKHIEWTIRAGEGLAYISRQYSRVPPVDTINRAISSRINGYTSLMTDVRWRVSEHLDVQAGLNLTHISNSSLRKPNLGLNLYGAHVGIRYFPVTSQPERIVRELPALSNRWLLQVRGTFGMAAAWAPFGPQHGVYVGSVFASKRWQSKNKFLGGVDYSYHRDIEAYLRDNGLETGKERGGASKAAVFAGNEFLMGRIGIAFQMGAYVKKAYLHKDDLYQKVGCNYYFIQRETGPVKEAFICVFLKTHLNVAEVGEIGMGIGL